jgi:hypothetical protein
MTTRIEPQTAPAPSLATLAKTTAIALVVAGIVLITIVLPAEYGIDPLGTGERMGLTAIANPPVTVLEMPDAQGAALAPRVNGAIGAYPREFKLDTFEVELGPYDYLEYKYTMEKGASMVYTWTATAGVHHDMHGEHPAEGGGEPVAESFDKTDRKQAHGTFTAPFTGIHGWFWENPVNETIKIRLTTAGFYSGAIEIRSDRTRHPHPLKGPGVVPAGAASAP